MRETENNMNFDPYNTLHLLSPAYYKKPGLERERQSQGSLRPEDPGARLPGDTTTGEGSSSTTAWTWLSPSWDSSLLPLPSPSRAATGENVTGF